MDAAANLILPEGAVSTITRARGYFPSEGRDVDDVTVFQFDFDAEGKVRVNPTSARGSMKWAGATVDLMRYWTTCKRCRLAKGRTNVVYGKGGLPAEVVLVGEAPGAQEDRKGLPFVGPAGELLMRELKVQWNDVVAHYITNVLGCKPPGNRIPMPDEVEACAPRLREIVQAARPKAILALGGAALTVLTGEVGITRWRGQWLPGVGNWLPPDCDTGDEADSIPVLATYHPAALLPGRIRNAGELESFRTDLRAVLRAVKGETR